MPFPSILTRHLPEAWKHQARCVMADLRRGVRADGGGAHAVPRAVRLAFPQEDVERMFAAASLPVTAIRHGSWRGTPGAIRGQDIVIGTRQSAR